MMTKHMVQRSITFLALSGIFACTGDPTGDFKSGPDHLVATPSAVYVGNGTIQTVLVSAVDEAGNQVEDNFHLGTVGAGITVTRDSTFDLVRNDKGELVVNPHPTRVRYNVTTSTFQATEFTVNAGSRSITIPVRTEPAALTGAISTVTPNLGDTVTITAPAGLSFSPTASVVTFGTTATFLVSRSATEIKFVPPPAVSGAASVSAVTADYAPGAGTFTVPTAATFTVPGFPLLTASVVGARAIGDSVTLTIPAPFKWGRGTPAASTILLSSSAAISARVVSADSSTVRFRLGPNQTDTLRINNLRIDGAPSLNGYILKAQAATTTPVVTNFAGVYSTQTPAVGEEITITAPGTFRFLPNATATLGGVSQNATRVSADSTTIFLTPPPLGGAATPVTINGVVFAALTSVSLNLPTVAAMTPPSGAATPLAGTDAFATAPNFNMAPGTKFVITDGGPNFAITQCTNVLGGLCRVYRLTVTATTTITFTANWSNLADLGIYFHNSAFAPITSPNAFLGCDAHGSGAGAAPETCTATFTAGTYYISSVYYGGGVPVWRQIFASGA
jgi:hypothetical protein